MAKGEKNTATSTETSTRNRYTAAQKEKAQKLYMKGISVIEIADLLNINVQTVKKWRANGKWKIIKEVTIINKREETKKLKQAGYKKKEIAQKLDLSLSTVWRYLKDEN